MTTTALDRFLYECKADAVALALEDMTCGLSNALDDLAGASIRAEVEDMDDDTPRAELLDLIREMDELREAVADALNRRREFEQAAERAVEMVWDLVEENRPNVA